MITSTIAHQNDADLNDLVQMLKFDSNVRACLSRTQNAILSDYPTFYENDKPLNPSFERKILPFYIEFIKNSIELFFFCGFVPYQLRVRDGIKVPITLELGSFTWTVNPLKKRNKFDTGNLLEYKVRPRKVDFVEKDVYIFNYVTPYLAADNILLSPLNRLLSLYKKKVNLEEVVLLSNQWNTQKHIAVTEKIDIKDQTVSGIQLLDQCRRYALSGTTGSQEQALLRLQGRNHESLANINEANAYWIRDQFGAFEKNNTDVHIMPPNTEIHELSSQTGISADLKFVDELFGQSVFAYFDMPSSTELSKKATSTSSEQMTRTQFSKNVALCRACEELCSSAYAFCMDVERSNVKCVVKPQSRLEVTDAADLKVLVENNILTGLDKSKLRRMYGF